MCNIHLFDSEKFIPSPMEETTLTSPRPVQIIQRSEDEISRVVHPGHADVPPLSPLRAQQAFYRSQIEDIPSYNPVDS